jgi:NADH-quinone oxidoreductase subunit J
MTAPLFLLFAAIAVLCGINLVVQTHPIASALSLIGVMGSLAALYLQLGGEFIAMAQIIVYAGAVMVLFVFVIMLLNAGAEPPTFQVSRFVRYFGAILLAAFLGLISFIIQGALPRTEGVIFGTFQGTTLDVGRKLFTNYLLPFEVVSILILIAIVGAIVLARKEV